MVLDVYNIKGKKTKKQVKAYYASKRKRRK